MLVSDAYFCWLRDSYGSYDEEAIDLKEKKEQSFTLQMMPQKYCKITGEFTTKDLKGKGLLWDFNLDYFNNANVNILNYDPSLINAFKNEKEEERLKNFIIDNNTELNDTNSYYRNHYVRTKVNKGAWCFKKNLDTFNIVPPFAYLLKSVFTDDLIEKLDNHDYTCEFDVTPAMSFGKLDYLKIPINIKFNSIYSGNSELTVWRYHNLGNTCTL
mgnify:CR=1 FL=1